NRCRAVRRHGAAAQDARPAEDRVERRAELVREHREEFVLHAVGLLEIANQLRALLGQRALVILELAPWRDVDHRAGGISRLAVVVEDDAPAILQPSHLAVVADDAILDAVLAMRGYGPVYRLHHTIVIVGVNACE